MINDLEYMDGFFFEPAQSIKEKIEKISEEFKEVLEAYQNSVSGIDTSSDLAQEALDLILVSVNLLKKLEKEERISLGTEFFKHSLKLGRYESEKKYSVEKRED